MPSAYSPKYGMCIRSCTRLRNDRGRWFTSLTKTTKALLALRVRKCAVAPTVRRVRVRLVFQRILSISGFPPVMIDPWFGPYVNVYEEKVSQAQRYPDALEIIRYLARRHALGLCVMYALRRCFVAAM